MSNIVAGILSDAAIQRERKKESFVVNSAVILIDIYVLLVFIIDCSCVVCSKFSRKLENEGLNKIESNKLILIEDFSELFEYKIQHRNIARNQ